MSDWPQSLVLPDGLITIGTCSICSIGPQVDNYGLGSAAWPASNRAIFVPFRISRSILVTNMFVFNGTATSGNFDIGIYSAGGTRLISKGATAQSGTSAPQTVDITDTPIGPGLFYMALAFNNTTATVFRHQAYGIEMCRIMGLAQMASAYALPATATFATITTANYIPIFGLTVRSVV